MYCIIFMMLSKLTSSQLSLMGAQINPDQIIKFDSNFIRFFKNKKRMLDRSSSLTILTIIKMKETKLNIKIHFKNPQRNVRNIAKTEVNKEEKYYRDTIKLKKKNKNTYLPSFHPFSHLFQNLRSILKSLEVFLK